MKNFITNIIIILILLLISYQILTESSIVIESVLYAVDIWKNSLFPPMFTFFVLSEILINYGFVEIIGNLFSKPANFLFKINKNGIFAIILGILSGFPSSAKYIKELLENNKITLKEANKLILFTHFSNPLFILGTIGTLLNKKLGIIILLSHYLGNLFIGIIIRNYNPAKDNKLENIKNIINNINRNNFIKVLSNAINNAINSALLVLGIITVCTIITNIIDKHCNETIGLLINIVFEITKGINYIGNSNINLFFKGLIITSMLSFGGISVHMQISSIISETKIKYMPFLGARILHVFLSIILYIIIFNLMYL